MVELTLLTVVFELLPPLIVTVIYLLFLGNRKNKFIEAFIVLMYLKTFTFFLYAIQISESAVGGGFDPSIPMALLSWIAFTDLLFHVAYTLQEYLTWVMVSFIAALFGMLVLGIKLALQEPLQMKFKNLIGRITGSEPKSDGYSGLRDRLDNIRFEGVEPQPLDPHVQAKAWREGWKDYLIIGLATLLPSISAYLGSFDNYLLGMIGHENYEAPDAYVLGVLIFLTWIYRFGYPASNRIAKGAGLKLGNRDIGGEMMQGVLGWFFRLNVLLTGATIAFDVWRVLSAPQGSAIALNGLTWMMDYYSAGLLSAAPPILFAILLLPLTEDFAVVLYKKLFDKIYRRSGTDVPSRTYDPSITNEPSGKTATAVSALVTGLLVTGVFVGSVMAVTLRYSADRFFHGAMTQFYLLPGEVDDDVFNLMNNPTNNFMMINPTMWTLLMLAIPFVSMMLIGIMGHFAKSRGGSNELFALIAGLTLSVATWFLLPGMDYMINIASVPANLGGSEFYRLRPIIIAPGDEQYLARLAAQFIVNLPIYVCTALFILYFFDYRKKWKEQTGEVSGPLLNVQRQDVIDATKLFALGLVCSVVGVWLLTIFLDPALVGLTIDSVFAEIAAPNGLEAVLEHYVLTQTDSRFLIIAEHNLIRTLLMLIIGPIFWASILWLVAAKRKDSVDNRLGWFSSMTLLVVAVGTGFWTLLDMERGYFDPDAWPWGLAANMALRALLVFGIFLVLILVVIGIRKATGRDMGIWWLPLFVTLFCLEYFVYDDQFTVIALVVLPLILTVLYRVALRGRPQVKAEDPLVTYIKMSLMSLAIAEVLSTALILGGLSIINFMYGGNVLFFLAHILPHAVVEIPAFLFAAAISFRIARDMWPSLEAEDWDSIPSKTRNLLSDERIWRTYALIVFFLLIAALIESFVTPLVVMMIGG